MERFKRINAKVDHAISKRWFQQEYIKNLNPVEKNILMMQ